MTPDSPIALIERSTSTGRARRSSAWRFLRTRARQKSNVWFATILATRNGSFTSPPVSRLNRSDARLRLPLGEAERTVEDRLRKEYFTLLPEIQRVADRGRTSAECGFRRMLLFSRLILRLY